MPGLEPTSVSAAAASTTIAAVPISTPPGAPARSAPDMFPATTTPVAAIDNLMIAVYDLQRQMADLATRLGQVENWTPPPALCQAPMVLGILKLSFPTFDGAEDPSGWLNRCDQFFHLQRTMDRDRVWLASFHLTGVAQQWYYQVDQDAGDVGAFTWDIFKALCLQRFAPAFSPHRPDELERWPCHATVDEVQEVVPARLASASQHSPHQQAHLPTSGLSDHVRVDVELPELQDPQRAMSLARGLERHGQAV